MIIYYHVFLYWHLSVCRECSACNIVVFVDRQLVFNHRQSLAEQLRQESDAAMTLHLASVLLVHVHTQCMVHAPGRCVPQIIAFLRQYLPADQYSILLRSQGAIIVLLLQCTSIIAAIFPDELGSSGPPLCPSHLF